MVYNDPLFSDPGIPKIKGIPLIKTSVQIHTNSTLT